MRPLNRRKERTECRFPPSVVSVSSCSEFEPWRSVTAREMDAGAPVLPFAGGGTTAKPRRPAGRRDADLTDIAPGSRSTATRAKSCAASSDAAGAAVLRALERAAGPEILDEAIARLGQLPAFEHCGDRSPQRNHETSTANCLPLAYPRSAARVAAFARRPVAVVAFRSWERFRTAPRTPSRTILYLA